MGGSVVYDTHPSHLHIDMQKKTVESNNWVTLAKIVKSVITMVSNANWIMTMLELISCSLWYRNEIYTYSTNSKTNHILI